MFIISGPNSYSSLVKKTCQCEIVSIYSPQVIKFLTILLVKLPIFLVNFSTRKKSCQVNSTRKIGRKTCQCDMTFINFNKCKEK